MKKRCSMIFVSLLLGICCANLFFDKNADAAAQVKIDTAHFPDKVFHAYVKKFDKDKNGYLSKKERKAVKKIFLSGSSSYETKLKKLPILNLQGIEYFSNVKFLYVASYKVKNLQLSKMKNLKEVEFIHMALKDSEKTDKEFDFTQNKKLEIVKVAYGNAKKVNFPKNAKIKILNISLKNIKNLKGLGQLPNLEELRADPWVVGNPAALESADLSGCSKLKKVNLSGNNLTNLKLDGCTSLEELDVSDNEISSLKLSGCPVLEYLNVSCNDLSALDLSANPALTELNCGTNVIREMDLSALENLRILNCRGMLLEKLDLGKNKNVYSVDCSANQIENLYFSGNTNLVKLYCSANPIEELDVSMLSELELLCCNNARLTNLDISENKKLSHLEYMGNRIPLAVDATGASENIWVLDGGQLLPSGGKTDSGIPIDEERFPDYALRYMVFADFDINHDGILSEEESMLHSAIWLDDSDSGFVGGYLANYRKEIDCTGLEYLQVRSVFKSSNTRLVNISPEVSVLLDGI